MVNLKRKALLIMLTTLLICTAIRILFPVEILTLYMKFKQKQDEKQKILLLYEISHNDFLRECRDLHESGLRGEFSINDLSDEAYENIPKNLMIELKPDIIRISDERVKIIIRGGIFGFGVYAYPEKVMKSTYEKYYIGDKMLIEGLWYFDSGYEPGHEIEYEEYLNSLKPK